DDLVRWSHGGTAASVRSGLNPATPLALSALSSLGATVRAVAGVGDLDGDGRDDIAVSWRGRLGNQFVTVFQVLPALVGSGERVELLASFDVLTEARFGEALGTAF
nr:FG-GAP repeat protein [Deltaproteobacteria bacterium]